MTQMISSKEIIKIFSYSPEEQETFEYLARYTKRINKKLSIIEADREKLRRYALAGLFLTYRAFNHNGNIMTTEISNAEGDESLDYEKLKAFKVAFNEEISDAADCLKKINLSFPDFVLMAFRIKNISKKLYEFVIK